MDTREIVFCTTCKGAGTIVCEELTDYHKREYATWTVKCANCDDTRWVCEAHPERPWGDSLRICTCGGAGMPCPVCNTKEPPELPAGFHVAIDSDKGPRH